MILSRDRILTTHVGSLPRNDKLSDLLLKREANEAFDAAEMASEMDKAVRHVIDKQAGAGIDIGLRRPRVLENGVRIALRDQERHRLIGARQHERQ